MASIAQIIATTNPKLYHDYGGSPQKLKEFKELIKEKGTTHAAEKARAKPVRAHKIVYDSSSETLEPIYFWILDMMNNFFGGKVEKLIDNFSSSPGSGHFSEMGQRKSLMQKNVTETMGTINTVIKSIINIIYDLKEFEIRLDHYKALESSDKDRKEAGMLALKQIWMDNVDIKRGQGSINALASGNLQFITLRDGFMAAKSVSHIEKMDLNDRVKRILKPRFIEFEEWTKQSKQELQKRFNIERNYLKSQVNSLKLYSRWVKPYLKAATKLEENEKLSNESSPEIVTNFNTIVLELALFGKNKVDVEKEIGKTNLPGGLSIPKREYYSIVVVDFHFRGIPQKAGQHYLFGGKATVNFQAYALNEDELKLLKKEMENSDVNDAFKLIEGITTESIDELQSDIDHYLQGKEKPEEKNQEEQNQEDTNPFSALFSGFTDLFKSKNSKKDKEINSADNIKKDSYGEKLVRKIAANTASETCFTIFDVYKKAHGMASHDSPFSG